MIFVIKHPNAAFSGFSGGIDFYEGIGSTSSLEDARRVSAKLGGTFAAADPEASGPTIVKDKPAPPAAETPKAKPGRKPK